MITQGQTQKDVPAVAAVALLGLVVGGFFYMKSPTTFGNLFMELDGYVDRHITFLTLCFVALSINLIWIYSIGSRLLGINQQGRKLELLTGKSKTTKRIGFSHVGALAGLLLFFTLDLGLLSLAAKHLPTFLPISLNSRIWTGVSINLSLALYVIFALFEGPILLAIKKQRKGNLPVFPKVKDGLVLGSINEGEASPEWMIQNRKGLNGNILITGSIGSGKTQGTILNYLDQILSNFDPLPSILAIDPKSTFIRVGKEIIEKHGLTGQVLHLKLNGNVTFNPVYQEGMLKNGGFSEVAQMIRAAAANYGIRSSQDGLFWELSSFNLIKNALVYCAAMHGYFTLKELYEALIRASDGSLGDELHKILKLDKFDEEEKFNIQSASDYLSREFSQLESKIRTSILATATSFLNQFQEYQAQRIFCPTENNLSIKSMDSVIREGKILLFDVKNTALARSMGTFIKLYYEQAVLNRYTGEALENHRPVLILIDEFQDVVSVGGSGTIGDDKYLAKAREANAIMIAASPSLSTLENAIGKEKAAHELFQSFRSRIACHSSDLATINNYKELAGQDEKPKESRSVSEYSQHPSRNLMLGGFESKNGNISESVSTSSQKEYLVTGKEFSRLGTFEAFASIFDGVYTPFIKLFLKPYFLPDKSIPHTKIIALLQKTTVAIALIFSSLGQAFPTVCSVLKTREARSCLDFSVSACVCPGIPPRPCAQISYYVPQTFFEVVQEPLASFFKGLPGTAPQLVNPGLKFPFGIEADNDSQSFHSHSVAVPLANIPFGILPCGGSRTEKYCFDGMSEHLGSSWSTGSGDLLQPNFLAWSLSPKACLLKGAATSVMGGSESMQSSEGMACSFARPEITQFIPSSHEACNGWGLFYPRSGTYTGPSQTAGALMIASRMKSLSQEVFQSTPGSKDEYWQMISPQSSSCFREGQNIGLLENVKNVRELGRLTGKLKDSLFVVWSKVSCCQELAVAVEARVELEAIIAACHGLGAL